VTEADIGSIGGTGRHWQAGAERIVTERYFNSKNKTKVLATFVKYT
jgi:hypothetical protein